MVVSSLLFAKNAPFMIRDAVKYLISKDASALVIKNVFCLLNPILLNMVNWVL